MSNPNRYKALLGILLTLGVVLVLGGVALAVYGFGNDDDFEFFELGVYLALGAIPVFVTRAILELLIEIRDCMYFGPPDEEEFQETEE